MVSNQIWFKRELIMENVFKQEYQIKRKDREAGKGYKSVLVWFTGLSGSGKSTLANELEKRLFELKMDSYILDGDNMRRGLNKDLSFSELDRKENIRRIAEVSNLFIDAGIICITAFISPFQEERELARSIVGNERFIEVYMNTPIEVCEQRDVKGLYKKARSGEIANFTGISSPFEEPMNPIIEIDTSKESLKDAVDRLLEIVLSKANLIEN